jgi:hypothetical protein
VSHETEHQLKDNLFLAAQIDKVRDKVRDKGFGTGLRTLRRAFSAETNVQT